MIKPIAFEDMREGGRYWIEEYRSLRPQHFTVLCRINENSLLARFEIHDGLYFSFWEKILTPSLTCRFWTGKPANKDRNSFPWPNEITQQAT